MAEFKLTFRDVVDALGISDVVFVDPTSINILPKRTRLIP